MISPTHYNFLLKSLGIKKVELKGTTGIAHSTLCNITLGKQYPSFQVATKIEKFIRDRWYERKGQTIPPEVAQVVLEIIYPPAPAFTCADEHFNAESK